MSASRSAAASAYICCDHAEGASASVIGVPDDHGVCRIVCSIDTETILFCQGDSYFPGGFVA
jgi:hypothetical protein